MSLCKKQTDKDRRHIILVLLLFFEEKIG